jgi:hypothetical protein
MEDADDETVDATPQPRAAGAAAAAAAAAPRTPPRIPAGAVPAAPLAALQHPLPVRAAALSGSEEAGWHVAVLVGGRRGGEDKPLARGIYLWHLPGTPSVAQPGVLAGVLRCPDGAAPGARASAAAGKGKQSSVRGCIAAAEEDDDADADADADASRDAASIALSPDGHTVYALARLVPPALRRAAAGLSSTADAGGADLLGASPAPPGCAVVALDFGAPDGVPTARMLLLRGAAGASLSAGAASPSCVCCFRATAPPGATAAAAAAAPPACRTLVVAAGRHGAAHAWVVSGPLATARGAHAGAPLPVAQLRRAPLTEIVSLSPVRPPALGAAAAAAGSTAATLLVGVCSSGAVAVWDVAKSVLLYACHNTDWALRAACPLWLNTAGAGAAAAEGRVCVLAAVRSRREMRAAGPLAPPPPADAVFARMCGPEAPAGGASGAGGAGGATAPGSLDVSPLLELPRPLTVLAARGGTAAAGLARGGVLLWCARRGRQTAEYGRGVADGDAADVTALAWATEPTAGITGTAGAIAIGDADGFVELYSLDPVEQEA